MIPLDLSTLRALDAGKRAELHESYVRPAGPPVLRPAVGRLLIRFGARLARRDRTPVRGFQPTTAHHGAGHLAGCWD